MSDYVIGTAGAREDLYRFLAACYYEPSIDFAEERLFDSIQVAASTLHPDLAESARKLRKAFAAQDIQTLLVDYTRLFIGPAQPMAMPYGSFWMTNDPSRRHGITMAVLEYYEQGGFDVSEEFHDLPDHVAVEFEFAYALNFSINQVQGDDPAAADSSALYRRFVLEHLASWIGNFCAAVKTAAETDFYREIAEMSERFVQIERDRLCAAS